MDFWNAGCPPCMRIKPHFEQLAKQNQNPNLVFASVDTTVAGDAARAYNVNAIPNFIFFKDGQVFKNFKGADLAQLQQTVNQLQAQLPTGKALGARGHDQLVFKQFKPSHLAPQGFTTLQNIDKMKEFIMKFADSETVRKEVSDVSNFKAWLADMKFEAIPQKAIDELVEMT